MAYTKNEVDHVFDRMNNDLTKEFWSLTIVMSFVRIFLFWMIPLKFISGMFSWLSFSKKKNREEGKKRWEETIDNLKKSGGAEDLDIAEIIESNQERFLTYYADKEKLEYQINIAASLLSIVWVVVFMVIRKG